MFYNVASPRLAIERSNWCFFCLVVRALHASIFAVTFLNYDLNVVSDHTVRGKTSLNLIPRSQTTFLS